MVNFLHIEVFLKDVFDLIFIKNPGVEWCFYYLFFLDLQIASIDFGFLEQVRVNSFVDLLFGLLLPLKIFLDIDQCIITLLFVFLESGCLFDLLPINKSILIS